MIAGLGAIGGLAAVVVAAAATLGFRALKRAKTDLHGDTGVSSPAITPLHARQAPKDYYKIELDLPNTQIVGDSMTEGELILQRDDVTVTFTRASDGFCKVHVAGKSATRQALEDVGYQLIGRIIQTYAYEKMKSEMEGRGYDLVEKSEEPDQSLSLLLRRWSPQKEEIGAKIDAKGNIRVTPVAMAHERCGEILEVLQGVFGPAQEYRPDPTYNRTDPEVQREATIET